MKAKLIPAIMVLLTVALPVSARLITFFPTELDFNTVAVGDTAWREVRFRYSGPDSGRVLIEIGSQRTFCFGNWQVTPEARSVCETIGAIFNAIKMFRQDFGEDPPSVERLLELVYLEIPDSITAQWEFFLIGSDPVMLIEAVSTDRMPDGAGHIVMFDIIGGRFIGWGINSGDFYLDHLEVYTIRIWFAPQMDSDYLDTLSITAYYGNSGGNERQLLPCSGTGWLAVENRSIVPPLTFELYQPFPNPFNSATTLSFSLSTATNLQLSITNLDGRNVAVIKEGFTAAGRFDCIWEAGNNSAGTYFVKLTAGDLQAVRQILLIR